MRHVAMREHANRGACLGCIQKMKRTTETGEIQTYYARVCKDGPVFASGTIFWEGLKP